MDDVIANIANGKCDKIGGGAFKEIYKIGDKAYATEIIRSKNATALYDRLKSISDRVSKHVLIPDNYVERNGIRYWEMDFCEADLNREDGNTADILQTFSIDELQQNFDELEETVDELHAAGITLMDIKPDNMLFMCGADRNIQLTDLDGSLIDGKGEPHQTMYYTFLKFQEDYVKQDKFALIASFLDILDSQVWVYRPMQWFRSMKDWTDDARARLDDTPRSKLAAAYLDKLDALEKIEGIAHASVSSIFELKL